MLNPSRVDLLGKEGGLDPLIYNSYCSIKTLHASRTMLFLHLIDFIVVMFFVINE